MLITAKFSSVCNVCRRQILSGDRVSWSRGNPAIHAACSQEGQAIKEAVAVSQAVEAPADVELPCPDGRDYLGYQRAGIAYALAHPGCLIADEMGLGKTIQAIGLVNASPDVRSVLVVCPASLKLNWRNEFQAWSTRFLSIAVFPAKADITIVNYDILKKLPADASWDLLILDEAHYAKNPKAQRTKLAQAISRRCKRTLALTGTPILNKPIEMWPILQMVAPAHFDPPGNVKGKSVGAGEGAGFFRFAKRYCNAHQERVSNSKTVWVFDGASNLSELQEKLRSTCMVRRLKADVLRDLPAKRRQVIAIGNGCNDEEDYGDIGDDYETAHKRVQKIAFEDFSRVRHEQALRKIPAAIEHIRDAVDSSGKVVVFAHHHDVIDALMAGLGDLGAVKLDGTMTDATARQASVERFQTDPSCHVFVGSLKAAGVGHTLTASAHVVFVELDWTPAILKQAEDRCHRIGQTESVLVQHLVLEGSIDAKMAKLITEKQNISDMALDSETIGDVSDRDIVETREEKRKRELAAENMTEADAAVIHLKIQWLAARCDGASSEDGAGYNKLDANIGHSLAAQHKLSARQAVFAKKLLVKYTKQLTRGGFPQ
jgi:SWI/SNF-related matrix-associated actin-dependent regulator 1 of chromatin subfamily A